MKKLLSIILAIMMLLVLMPAQALAQGGEVQAGEPACYAGAPAKELICIKDQPAENSAAAPNEIYSGQCGDNVYWSFDTSSGMLSISGTGDMYDFDYRAPWDDSTCEYITSASIQAGVTSIGDHSFDYLEYLTSISIPDTVTRIGVEAFSYCSALTSISIPDGVTSIGGAAFSCCTSLKSVSIPDGMTSIENALFEHCTSLKSISIPDGVTSIGVGAFSYCSALTSISIPDGVTSIGGTAFACCTSLKSVSIPDGMTSIDNALFEHCTSLTSITIPANVTSVGWVAFSGCSSLKSAVFLGAPPETFWGGVFDYCDPSFCIYYDPDYAELWSPNGETTWRGYPIAPMPDGVPGDADGNGFVDTTDALLVLRCALNISGDPGELIMFCDMDGNGAIDTTDALLILRIALGIV